ncbi:hypothetical protein EV363DRAFT_1447032 [Boletus edulis]|nr:hypothetical protein EV363DRAFT_1447032 [Boletus edulis]
MAEIYSDLPSPVLGPLMNENARLSRGIASGDAIWGLRTTLYGYQRHSVAIMLHRESSTSPVLDPLYIPVSCMTGFHCYVRPSTMTVLRECPTYSPSQAGILCEELGTGKTVMIIALVLATASQLADPEGSMVDHRPVMTPLAYLHFPSTEHALARDRAGLGQRVIQQVPSLVELLIHYFSSLKATTGRPAFADELKATHLWPVIQANKPFYHHYKGELLAEALKRSSRRAATNLCPRTMYPSTATLVVVPLALLDQWKTEIDKHCYDNVRYLIVRRSMDLPDARKLASDYELIIMTDTRFRMESKKNKTEKLHDLKPCTCPCLAESRVPDCHCLGDCNVTPLLQVRWKRLVIDEGHIAGNTAATINYFVQELSIQHKWIVTGTPTSNLLGLQLGRTTDEEDFDLVYPDSDSPEDMSSTQDEGHRDMRIWGSYDRQNLRKLGTMIGDFLSVPQFRTDTKYFKHHVSTLLCDQRGPRPGAIDVLTQVMQMVMVRHRIEDVENDVLLPPMRHDIIRMDLDGYALKSYNAMQAALAINAIDSEREGTDYLFHPSVRREAFSPYETVLLFTSARVQKAQELQTTINNSLQGLFWSASDILYNVDQICDLADEFIARAVRRQVDPEDLDLLQQALKHAQDVESDATLRRRPVQDYLDLIQMSLKRGHKLSCATGSRTIDVMHPDRLMELRSLVRKKPLISRDKLVEEGKILDRKEKRMMASKSTGARQAKRGANQRKEMEKEVQGKIKTLKEHVERMTEDEEVEDCQDGESVISTKAAAARTLVFSPLSGVKVGPSVSTKLNYILSEIQEYSAKEKFLIFSNSLLTLYQVGEALSLFEIKYLRYTNQEKYLLREQCITTFETSDVYRVLLMELKRGARGLNLISASRIIFCEPVWHPDVESQAIKRAHRIGQTRPVTAKTLVIRSTAEEEMIARRQYLRSSDKVPNMTTESGMRQYLQNPRFLAESASNDLNGVVLSLDDDQSVAVGTEFRANMGSMLAIITQDGTSLIDPTSLKNSSGSFPVSTSLECFTNAWSPDNTQLYLASSSSIKRYTPSEALLEELYRGSDTVTCLAMKDKSSILFFAAANRVWSLDCTHSPGKVLSSLEPHKNTVTRVSVSNDGTLLASVSASAVIVHDLTQSSHTQLKGLPDRKPVVCCSFHQHSRTRLLLGVGRDLVVYDSMRPSSPLKTVRIPGGGDIVGVAASPFSKTLVAVATTNGDVVLVDLDKGNGILKTVNLLILDLRSLEKEPKSFIIGDNSASIKAINVQGKPKSRHGDTSSVKVKSSSTVAVKSSPQRPAPSTRSTSVSAVVAGYGVKSPARVMVASKIRGGGGVTLKKNLLSPARSPLSETRNLGLDPRLAASRSPTLFRRVKQSQRSRGQEENQETHARPPSPTSELTELAGARQRAKASSSHKMGLDVGRLGLGPAPESISGHLAAMRVRSDPPLNDDPRDEGGPKTTTRRIVSEFIETASNGRKYRPTSAGSAHNKVSSSKAVARTQKQERRSATPDNSDDRLDLSSPELPREPVTPISLWKNTTKPPLTSATCTSSGVLGLASPEVAKWAKGESQKGKGKEKVAVKKARFAQQPDAKESSGGSDDEEEEEGSAEIAVDERLDEEREQELSLQVSPRRPTAPPTWLRSPHRPSTANLNMNGAAQDFLRNIVHDVMYDFQRETKAEMMGLHLDLVRTGRGWKRELREIMEERNSEIQELKAENRRLKEENERLRRGI